MTEQLTGHDSSAPQRPDAAPARRDVPRVRNQTMTDDGSPAAAVDTSPTTPERRIRGRGARLLRSRTALAVIGLALIGALWEASVRLFDIPRFVLIGPIEAIEQFFIRPGYFAEHVWVTLVESLLGFVGGTIAGVIFGLILHYSPLVNSFLYPSLIGINTIPKVALAPLFVIWFGYGTGSKAMVALAIAFFPIVVATVDGLRSVPLELRELAEINRSSSWQRVRKIDLIYALPTVFIGMKISISMAVGGAVVGEFIAGRSGLGYVILAAVSQVNLPAMFAAFIALAVMALLLFMIIDIIHKIAFPWAQSG